MSHKLDADAVSHALFAAAYFERDGTLHHIADTLVSLANLALGYGSAQDAATIAELVALYDTKRDALDGLSTTPTED
jgi:hypothetical protein